MGKQIILNTSQYTTRHNIMEEVKRRTAENEKDSAQQVIDQAKDMPNVEEKAATSNSDQT
jgi:flagellar assembly factor FliW